MYKYHYAERPKLDYKVEITATIEVPAVPAKDQRKKNPDKSAFEATLANIENQIEAKREKIRSLGLKKKETLEGGKVSGSQLTFRDYIKEKRKEEKGKRKTASRGNAARETRRGRGMTVTTRSIPRSDKYRKPIGPPLNLMRRVPPSGATHL